MKDNGAIVSVIIPYHKEITPKWMLEEAINSVKNQSIPTEIIVIDDPTLNVSEARNKGLEKSDHRFIAFLDADDLWNNKKIARQLEMLDQTGTGLCIETKKGIPQGKIPKDEFIKSVILDKITNVTSSILIDTQKVNTKFRCIDRFEDHLFMIEAASTAGVCSCENLTQVRKHSRGLSHNTDTEIMTQSLMDYSDILLNEVPEIKKYEQLIQREIWYRSGIQARKDALYMQSIRYFIRSMKHGIGIKNVRSLMALPLFCIIHVCKSLK